MKTIYNKLVILLILLAALGAFYIWAAAMLWFFSEIAINLI